jgi:hypothetical protein
MEWCARSRRNVLGQFLSTGDVPIRVALNVFKCCAVSKDVAACLRPAPNPKRLVVGSHPAERGGARAKRTIPDSPKACQQRNKESAARRPFSPTASTALCGKTDGHKSHQLQKFRARLGLGDRARKINELRALKADADGLAL